MKAKWGALMVDGRGKAGGHVMSKNRGGAYMRTKVTPSNPQTTSQQTTRSSLSSFAQSFRSLTQLQIAGWNNAVQNFKGTNIFGDVVNPSGINLYVKLNTLLALVGAAALTDAPLPGEVASLLTLSGAAAAGAGTFTVAFTPTPVPADHSLVILASKQFSPGVSAFKGKSTVIKIVAAAGASPSNVFAAYTAKYGSLIEGQKIAIEAFFVNEITGQKSISLHNSLVVAA